MLSPSVAYLLLFSANLSFIVTHLYGWLLKWYYRPKAYRDHFHQLFPAQRAVGVIYLLQLFELPYLLQVGDADALLFVNAFALLFFSFQMLVMCELYFFTHNRHGVSQFVALALPVVVVLLPLFLQAVGVVSLPDGWRLWAFVAVTLVFLPYLWRNVRMALRIGRAVREVNEASYADRADFPVRFAQYIQWVPTLVLVLLTVNFFMDDVWVKFVRDILFIGANVWFCMLTLNPWRTVFTPTEEKIIAEMERADASSFRLADSRYEELRASLQRLLEEEHVFTEPHITIDTLVSRLATNANYLSEVIKRSGYRSFYDMINHYRVDYAIGLIREHRDEKLLVVAERCGFSSAAAMTRAFRQQGRELPSAYRESEK